MAKKESVVEVTGNENATHSAEQFPENRSVEPTGPSPNQIPEEVRRRLERDDTKTQFVVPRDMVILPSLGKLYSKEHPLYNKEEIEIQHMTAAEEDILTSRNLLRTGKAVDVLLQSCIVDKRIKVEDLIVGDKNSIMTFLRISGYGPEYDVKVDCPSCEEEIEHTFDLSQLPVRTLDGEPTENNTFSLQLPSGNTIEYKFLNSAEEAEITQLLEDLRRKTQSPLEKNVTLRYSRQIVSVNGDSTPETIAAFANSMIVRDSRFFRKHLQNTEPDVIMRQPFQCPLCGHREEIDIPISVNFFWPE